jgi:osmotically-inducible protein OsmY
MIRRRQRRGAALAVTLLLVVLIAGCSSLRRPGPVVDRANDPRILQEVEARIAREPSIDAAEVRVEVDGAIVILHGSVRGLAAWQCAIRTAQLAEGVQSVVDFLVIQPGPREVTCLGSGPPR